MHAADSPGWRVVVISPHFDDAALSVGGFILSVESPKAVVTVHGGAPAAGVEISQWDADCGFRSAAEAHRTRLAEDRRACDVLGADQVVLDNSDNPYRTAGHLVGLRKFLSGLGAQTRILLPLGSNQPDHLAVRETALGVLNELGPRQVGIYADLPYTAATVSDWLSRPLVDLVSALELGNPEYRELAARHQLTVRHDAPISDALWADKRQVVFAYASQLSLVGAMGEVAHLGPLLRYPGAAQRELIWSLGAEGYGEW
jgi:LmbE family N-acetylglucosaminyl deacetylase